MRKIFLTGDIHSDVWDLKQRILQAQVPEGGFIFVL